MSRRPEHPDRRSSPRAPQPKLTDRQKEKLPATNLEGWPMQAGDPDAPYPDPAEGPISRRNTHISTASAIHDTPPRDEEAGPSSSYSNAWAGPSQSRAFEPGTSEGAPGGRTAPFLEHSIRFLPSTSNPNTAVGGLNSQAYWRTRLRNCLPNSERRNVESAEMEHILRDLNIYSTSHRQDRSILPRKPTGKTKLATFLRGTVHTNHFVVQARPTMPYILYKVAWADRNYPRRHFPRFVATALWRKLIDDGRFNHFEGHPENLVYEGGTYMISPTRFSWQHQEFDLVSNTATVRASFDFHMEINTADLDTFLRRRTHDDPQEFPEKLVTVANAIMKQYFRQDVHEQKYFESGRFFFISGGRVFEENIDLNSELIEGKTGYFQSLRLLEGGLTLNVDVMAAAFYKPNIELVQAWYHMLSMGSLIPQEHRDLFAGFGPGRLPAFNQRMVDVVNQYWRNLAITSTHRQSRWTTEAVKLYSIRRVIAEKADSISVQDYGDNVNKNLIDLMRVKYNLPIIGLLGVLPAIQVHKEKDHYLPWGCCSTHPGARFPHKLEPRTQVLLHQSRVNTRCESILRWIHNRYTRAARPDRVIHAQTENRYNLHVRFENMMQVTALSLSDPKITPSQQNHVARPANIGELWGVLSFIIPQHKMMIQERFIELLKRRGLERGMTWGERVVLERVQNGRGLQTFDAKRENVRNHIQNLKSRVTHGVGPFHKLKLILIFMEKKMSPEYATLKYELDITEGVPSQVIILPKSEEGIPMMLNNILLKINVKCGGQNFDLSKETKRNMPLLRARTILMGADVTHPGSGEETPSVAAVVATTDRHGVNYAVRLRAQDGRVERLVQLQEMVQELLQIYRDTEGAYPDTILFFRDGISEKFVLTSLRYEGTAILQAAEALSTNGNYKPKVAIVLAIKRHHTRFFVFQDRQMNDNRTMADNRRTAAINLPRGSVVADGVTHPIECDFFLASHDCRIGTSRPTHYHVLLDQINIQADELYTLVYYLCWTFQRCHSKSVSLVTPVYYAHLAAFRAKMYVELLSATRGNYDQIDAHPDLRNRLWFL